VGGVVGGVGVEVGVGVEGALVGGAVGVWVGVSADVGVTVGDGVWVDWGVGSAEGRATDDGVAVRAAAEEVLGMLLTAAGDAAGALVRSAVPATSPRIGGATSAKTASPAATRLRRAALGP
jgi:hypothetical protein